MPKQTPKIYYGLHFYPGVAEYRQPKSDPFRVFVSEDAIRRMGPSFAGKPVYVRHVSKVDLENLENEMDGLVVESFFNKADGKHWTKFAVTSDEGHQAIANGWKLSNAYHIVQDGSGGVHNGLDYDKEVVNGVYDHLALVDDPRYEESVILTPEQFKEYNAEKESELLKLANSKSENKETKKMPKFNFFKRQKIENGADLENTVVELPESKKEMTISELINAMDKIENMQGYANGDHMVKMDDEEMSVNDLVKKYGEMKNKMAEGQDEEKEPKLANDEDDGDGDDMENDQDEEKEPKLANEADEEEEEVKPAKVAKKAPLKNAKEEKGFAKKLMNASEQTAPELDSTLDLPMHQVQRGRDLFGSDSK